MSSEQTIDQPSERARPTLARAKSPAVDTMLRRVTPDAEAVPEDGVTRLDVCAFNSSI